MAEYNFTGDWEFKLDLDRLSKNQIDFRIIDVHNENLIPEQEQMNAINYLIHNQDKIFERICNYLNEELIPKYNSCKEETDRTIEVSTGEDSYSKEFVLGCVRIFNRFKDGYAYVMLCFSSARLDPEHGIDLIFHKDRFIGTNEDFKEAYEDMGLDYKQILKEISLSGQKQFENKDYKFHEPTSDKYSIKPWQQQENRVYPFRLLQTKQQDRFIDFMENKGLKLNYELSSLLNIAENNGLEKAIEFLKNK